MACTTIVTLVHPLAAHGERTLHSNVGKDCWVVKKMDKRAGKGFLEEKDIVSKLFEA